MTFDDGYDTQFAAAPILANHKMAGTFYINSGDVGTAGHLTWTQLDQLAAAGNEVGGHTIDHVDLTKLTTAQAQYQICQDRTNLLAHGYPVTDFAYPYGYGYDDPTIESLVQQCGYSSARMAWGIGDGVYAETIPPANTWAIRVPSSAETYTLSGMESYVTAAEDNGGGWVPLYFHQVCSGCAANAVAPADLSAFLDWLTAQPGNVKVETVAQVISGTQPPPPPSSDTTPPVTAISCNGSACSTGWYAAPVQVALNSTDNQSGVALITYTTDGTQPTTSSTPYTAPFQLTASATVAYRAWDNAGNAETTRYQQINIDTTAPTVAITSPLSGSTVRGVVKVKVQASDTQSGLALVTLYVDGEKTATSSRAPYDLTWNTKKVAKGTHTLTASAQDRVGHLTTSSPATVTVK